jgi:hypothetical protein
MNTEITVRPELRMLPIILSSVLVGMGAAVCAVYSLPMLGFFFGAAPVGLILLWMTRGVPAPEDLIAAADLRARAGRAPDSRVARPQGAITRPGAPFTPVTV